MAYVTRRRAGLAAACALLAAAASVPATVGAATGSVTTGSYTGSAGTLAYELYVPSSYQAGTAVPLVVALHGCTESADQFRQLSRFDEVAEAKGFLSAGGAMASVMGATYPDVYAVIGVGSGCDYTAGAACAGSHSADPEQAGLAAYKAMGTHARPMPFVIFQGDQDTTVPPINAQQDVRANQVTADWADDGAENGSVPAAPMKATEGQVSGGRSYTTTYYSDGHGHELGQLWMVHGMRHAWSGGDPAVSYADPTGPNESAAMYDFFMSHPAP
jgi:poly(3-hydroxybutyrate) depolymerase